MITVTTVRKLAATVTPEQIGRCSKIFDANGKPFYLVLSESDNLTEYRVSWSKQFGFQCSCPAGAEGFIHCKNNCCKHVVWSVACAEEEKQAMAEQARYQAAHVGTIDGKPVSQASIDDLMNRQPAKTVGKAKAFQPKAFSILK